MTFPLSGVDGLSVSVLGAARSGLAAARLLQNKGARVFVSDMSAAESMQEADATLRTWGIAHEFGLHTERVFTCDLMVISPGVPSNAPVVQEAMRRGVEVVSELECASWFCTGPVVAITGTNGKTTTTTLIGRMLADAKKAHKVGGNIGTAFSAIVDDVNEKTVGILEVSSFQLDHIRSFHPAVSVLLNVTPDHMDRYGGSFERYAASKSRVTMNQDETDLVVYNADDEWSSAIAGKARCASIPFSTNRVLTDGAWLENGAIMSTGSGEQTNIIDVRKVSIRGMHNVSNAMAALLVSQRLGVREASIRATLSNFKGVEHRIEFVRELDGVRFYNDSKATNIDSVVVALAAFEEPVVLLLGGRDKGNDYDTMKDQVRRHVKAIVAIGESSGKVREAFRGVVPVEEADSMKKAVLAAAGFASAGDAVLLSPACASFDWFKNYEHRGNAFKEMVRSL